MAKKAIITAPLQSMLKIAPGTGVRMIKSGQFFPDVWSYIKKNPNTKIWNNLKINEDNLEYVFLHLNTNDIKAHVEKADGMNFFGKLRECKQVEDDLLFQWDTKYVMAFFKMIDQYQSLGSPDLFWKTWMECNEKSMNFNTSINQTSPTSALMREEKITQSEAKELIVEGAQYRCKRNYAAFVREMYVLLSLGEANHQGEGMRVFWHPLWDTVCKCDAIVVPDKFEKMGVVGLAVYLKSRRSNRNASIKSNLMPKIYTDSMHHIMSLPVPIDSGAYKSGKIILPSDSDLAELKLALNGDTTAMINLGGGQYYSKNENLVFNTKQKAI